MFEQCSVCVWRMRNKCACGLWSLIGEREVCYERPKPDAGHFALRCLHCGRHNPIDADVARASILPEILNATESKWEWDHPTP